jgi:hypothetical protein
MSNAAWCCATCRDGGVVLNKILAAGFADDARTVCAAMLCDGFPRGAGQPVSGCRQGFDINFLMISDDCSNKLSTTGRFLKIFIRNATIPSTLGAGSRRPLPQMAGRDDALMEQN